MTECSTINSFFCFRRSGPHASLHPFPTRRSSDLAERPARFDHAEYPEPPLRRAAPYAGPPRGGAGTRPGDGDPGQHLRSEEHTSELQSRPQLVCRVLLEKKKAGLFSATPQTRATI